MVVEVFERIKHHIDIATMSAKETGGMNEVVSENWKIAIDLFDGLTFEQQNEFRETYPSYADRVQVQRKTKDELSAREPSIEDYGEDIFTRLVVLRYKEAKELFEEFINKGGDAEKMAEYLIKRGIPEGSVPHSNPDKSLQYYEITYGGVPMTSQGIVRFITAAVHAGYSEKEVKDYLKKGGYEGYVKENPVSDLTKVLVDLPYADPSVQRIVAKGVNHVRDLLRYKKEDEAKYGNYTIYYIGHTERPGESLSDNELYLIRNDKYNKWYLALLLSSFSWKTRVYEVPTRHIAAANLNKEGVMNSLKGLGRKSIDVGKKAGAKGVELGKKAGAKTIELGKKAGKKTVEVTKSGLAATKSAIHKATAPAANQRCPDCGTELYDDVMKEKFKFELGDFKTCPKCKSRVEVVKRGILGDVKIGIISSGTRIKQYEENPYYTAEIYASTDADNQDEAEHKFNTFVRDADGIDDVSTDSYGSLYEHSEREIITPRENISGDNPLLSFEIYDKLRWLADNIVGQYESFGVTVGSPRVTDMLCEGYGIFYTLTRDEREELEELAPNIVRMFRDKQIRGDDIKKIKYDLPKIDEWVTDMRLETVKSNIAASEIESGRELMADRYSELSAKENDLVELILETDDDIETELSPVRREELERMREDYSNELQEVRDEISRMRRIPSKENLGELDIITPRGTVIGQYKEFYYEHPTPQWIADKINTAFLGKNRVMVKYEPGYEDFTGYTKDGLTHYIYIGRSTGSMKIPLSIISSRSMGGGSLMTDHIEDIKILWDKSPRANEGFIHPEFAYGENPLTKKEKKELESKIKSAEGLTGWHVKKGMPKPIRMSVPKDYHVFVLVSEQDDFTVLRGLLFKCEGDIDRIYFPENKGWNEIWEYLFKKVAIHGGGTTYPEFDVVEATTRDWIWDEMNQGDTEKLLDKHFDIIKLMFKKHNIPTMLLPSDIADFLVKDRYTRSMENPRSLDEIIDRIETDIGWAYSALSEDDITKAKVLYGKCDTLWWDAMTMEERGAYKPLGKKIEQLWQDIGVASARREGGDLHRENPTSYELELSFEDGTTKKVKLSRWQYMKLKLAHKLQKSFPSIVKVGEMRYTEDDDESVHIHIRPASSTGENPIELKLTPEQWKEMEKAIGYDTIVDVENGVDKKFVISHKIQPLTNPKSKIEIISKMYDYMRYAIEEYRKTGFQNIVSCKDLNLYMLHIDDGVYCGKPELDAALSKIRALYNTLTKKEQDEWAKEYPLLYRHFVAGIMYKGILKKLERDLDNALIDLDRIKNKKVVRTNPHIGIRPVTTLGDLVEVSKAKYGGDDFGV